MIRKTALLSGAVLALSLVSAPVALAQDSSACEDAKKVVVNLQADVDDAAAKERVEELAALKVAKDALQVAQAAVVTAQKALDEAAEGVDLEPLKAALASAKDVRDNAKAKRDKAQERFDNDSDKVAGLRARLNLAITERDNTCGGVTTTPTTPPVADDVDCDEVSGERAQEILDADKNDPNDLDQDGDGIACEVDEVLDTDDEVVVPSGGVATGGGPA